jgi:hypothetical protein
VPEFVGADSSESIRRARIVEGALVNECQPDVRSVCAASFGADVSSSALMWRTRGVALRSLRGRFVRF